MIVCVVLGAEPGGCERSGEEWMMKAFISYSSVDREFARRLYSDLKEREGIDIWVDELKIAGGDSIVRKVGEGLSEADVCILVLSPDSVESDFVSHEASTFLRMKLGGKKRAMQEGRARTRRLVPVLYRECDIPPYLQDLEYVRITNETYEEGFQLLVSAIRGVPTQAPPKKEPSPPLFLTLGAPNGEQLLARLKQLTPAQFEEILFRLSVDVADLPGSAASHTERAMTLIRRLGQQEAGLRQLQELLDDLKWFAEFLPHGAYRVGRRLFEREEGRERQMMTEAAARGEDPEKYRVTREEFYTFRPEASWLGVLRNWDAPRSFHSELLAHVLSTRYPPHHCPAAAIIGPGGSGKSVALRRLAVDLAQQGQRVWWVEEPERLIRFGLSQLASAEPEPCFLMLDEIEGLEDQYAKRLRSDLQRHPSLILVVAGRHLPGSFRGRVTAGAGLFEPDEAADRATILAKIAETIPAWAQTAGQLAAEPLRNARLIRVLLVLARREAAPSNLEELETTFLEILADDIRRIRAILPGLAEAVIDAAAMREVHPHISRRTLIALADHYQPMASIPSLLEEVVGNPRWQALAPLVSHDPQFDKVQFYHDELAEGLILAGQRNLLGPRIVGDDAWRKATLDLVIRLGSRFSSSCALSGAARRSPPLVSSEHVVRYVRQLLAAGNDHPSYLCLIVDERLPLEQRERLELLSAAAQFSPCTNWLWGEVWSWIRHYPKAKAGELLEQLYQAGCRAPSILNPLLDHLPLERAKGLAREWLADAATSPDVRCSCLDLLGTEAQEDIEKLLTDPATHPHVLSRCFGLVRKLGLPSQKAKNRAEILVADPATPTDVWCRSLELLQSVGPPSQEVKERAELRLDDPATPTEVNCRSLELLQSVGPPSQRVKERAKLLLDNPATPREVKCRCLALLDAEAQPFAVERLRSWRETDPDLLGPCLRIAGATPDGQQAIEEMLARWDESVPERLRAAALRVPQDVPRRTQRAWEVLLNWQAQYRPLVTAALGVFYSDPDAVIEFCRAILDRWPQEIRGRRKRKLPEYNGHIVKALSHPHLREHARRVAQHMLRAEAKDPHFLSEGLRRWAEDIMLGRWPSWTAAEESTT